MRCLLHLVFITILMSCSTTKVKTAYNKEAFTEQHSIYIERVQIDTVSIPADSIRVEIPFYVFETDTIIQYRNKRVSGTITTQNGVVSFDAKCDSLEKLVLSYRTQLKTYQSNETTTTSNKEEIKTPWYNKGFPFIWVGFTVMILLVIGNKLFKV